MNISRLLCAAIAQVVIVAGAGCTMLLGELDTDEDDGGTPAGCAAGADCPTACADQASCIACERSSHPTGSALLMVLADCQYCTACYDACNGASVACSPPAHADACDKEGATCDPNTGCPSCAISGTCKGAFDDCFASPDCMTLIDRLSACPDE
ncbi:MAG: hypothetical protein U0359_22305 [Byssovorax sp.]